MKKLFFFILLLVNMLLFAQNNFPHWGLYTANGIDEPWSFYKGYISQKDDLKKTKGFTNKNYDGEAWTGLIKKESYSLFNGKDLTGWHVDVPDMDNNPETKNPFIIRDQMLVSLGDPRGHLITDSIYQDYKLEVEYRFPGEPGNCGVLVHASTPRTLYDMFPKSIEVQMEHTNAGDFWCIVEDIEVSNMEERRGPKENWGITEGKERRIKNLTEVSENPLGQWNTMVIECRADAIKVWVNEELVNEGFNATAKKGHIALQAEGAEVEFKKIEITPL